MNLKLQHVSKASMTFLMALFSVLGFSQSTYTLVTSVSGLEAGAKYLVANGQSGTVTLLGYQNTNNRPEASATATVTSNTLTVTPATAVADQAKPYEITLGGTSGAWVLNDDVYGTVLGPDKGNTTNNYLKANLTGVPTYTITFSTNAAVMTCVGSERNTNATARNIIRYNTIGLFSSYGTGQNAVYLFKKNVPTWNGTAWSNGTPTASTPAIIAGNYNGAGFTAQSVTVNSGFTLTINSGQTVTTGNLTNNGAVIVNDGGNLIQTATGTYSGTGTFTVNKNGASALDKYAFWSSPVASQNLATMYGAGLTPSFITEYNTATDYFVAAASNTSVVGKGYSIKTPAAAASGIFVGTPNNGAQTYTLATTGSGHNLVGNPYPSNLDLAAFYNANSGRINSTFYFWDNTSNSVTTQGGTTSVNIGYATYNALSQTWAAAPNSGITPTGNGANIGQGFFVQTLATPTDTSLSFTNDMRVATTGTFFNKTTNNTEGKFWLRINSSYNTNNTLAVAYLAPASDSFDNYDSKAIATGSDAFYTMADAQKLLIQGKAGFDTDDVVPVGTKHFQNGNFVISLIQKEGVFNAGQPIYLHDKVSGTYTNLQNGTYSFTANSGEFTERFEIVYKLNVLATTEVEKAGLEVYRDGEDFVVRNTKNIDSVTVYDAAGRMITKITANSKLIRIPVSAKGMYILKAVSEGKEYSKKIIK